MPKMRLSPSLLLLCGSLLPHSDGFRILNSTADPLAATRAVFEPYVKGSVGYYGDPTNPDPERVNEGAPFSPDTPRVYLAGALKQNCPGMVGPINKQEYYCRGREYGYCDRRSGLCVCNQGYTGLDCTDCKPSYFKKGGLCYPKSVCDYETGTCACSLNRGGDDCSRVYCAFDAKCTSCSATVCLSCVEGFYVEPATQTCVSCKVYDPRCLACSASRCLQCADPLLNSVRRSGARSVDQPLPFDELNREFSFKFSYGSQDPRVFDEAEVFELVPSASTGTKYLNDSSVSCVQGQSFDASWTCQPNKVSHRVCGHAGVFSFTSPIYAVPETAQNITLTVQRSGGGLGAASVMYDVQHATTNGTDVSATAFYTSSQTLQFADGVVNMSFLLTIHDDHVVEANETFRVLLRSPSDGSFLGNQRQANVTIIDNDLSLTDASLTYFVPFSGTVLEKAGNAGDTLTFQVQAVLGDGSTRKIGGDLLLMESFVADEAPTTTAVESLYRPKLTGQLTDHANGTYTVTWQRKHAGNYTVAVYLLYPNGLQGDYYADAWLSGAPVVSRIDRKLNFTWNRGPLFPGASDYVGVRWSGRLKPKVTGDTTLYVDCDDHVRLWLGDVLLIDRWSLESDGGVQAQAAASLDSTVYYAIQIEYRELADDARISLSWSATGLPKEIVPASSLYTAQHIRASPVANVTIAPALSSSAATSYLQGTFATTVATPLALQLFPVDAYGNARKAFDPKVDVYRATLSLTTDLSLGGVGSKTVDCDVAWRRERAAFAVACVPFFSGTHALNVYLNGALITGSPFAVAVQPNRMHPTRSVLSGVGLASSRIAGTATTVALETRDLNANRIYSSSGAAVGLVLRAIHTTRSGAVDLGTTTDNGDGTYTFTYTPRFIGTYLVHITQNGAPIHNSPYTVAVVPNVAVGPTSVATGAGLSAATTNVQSSFQIQSRDANSNNLVASGAVYQAVLEHAKGNVTGACTDLLNSQYSCTYTPKYVGPSRLHIGLLRSGAFSPITGSPLAFATVAGPALGSLCFATGTALVSSIAGQTATFTVTIHDYFDNAKLNAGLETVSVAFIGPAPSVLAVPVASTGLQVAYNGDGTYRVAYTLQTKGAYQIQVGVDGVPIHASPFAMYTYPAAAAFATTTIDLLTPVATPVVYYAGAKVTTRITSRDAFGNVLESGGSRFEFNASFANASLVDAASLVDELNGSYVFQFTPTVAMRYELSQRILYPGGLNATFYGSPDLVRPAKLQRVDAAIDFDFGLAAPLHTDDEETFSVQWAGYLLPKYSEIYTLHATVRGGMHMAIQQRRLFASLWPNAINAKAAEQLALAANRLVPIEVNFSKPHLLRNASVRLEWESLSQPREVIASDRFFTGRTFVNNVPPLAVVPDVADSPSFTADFPAGSVAEPSVVTATAGDVFTFLVTARDRFGNKRLTGGDRITLLFPQLPDDIAIVPSVVDNGDATYAVSFTPKLRGDFSMVVAATRVSDDIHAGTGTESLLERLWPFLIRQSPFTLRVRTNRPLAATSTLVGDGASRAVAGVEASFVVELRDVFSNRVDQQLIPAGQIVVRLRQLADPTVAYDASFGDAVDGRLAVHYTVVVAGTYEVLLAVLDGVLVQKLAALRVSSNLASALTSSAAGSGLGPQIAANTLLSYQITLRDAFQNALDAGGDDLAVVVRGPATVYGDVVDLQTGQYLVTYALQLAGEYEIQSVLTNHGRGLVGTYFESTQFARVGVGAQWVDAALDFDWAANETMRNYPRVQWRGFLKPLYTETYTLSLAVFPAGAVYIDATPVIDGINAPLPTPDGVAVLEGTVDLVAGRLHRIVVEYRSPSQREVRGALRLQWRSARQPQQLIPAAALRPDGQELPRRFKVTAV